MTEMYMEVPETIKLLRNLRKGDSLTFYKGDYPVLSKSKETPFYDALIDRIFSEAKWLEQAGKIEIHTDFVTIKWTRTKWTEWKGKTLVEERVVVKTWTALGLEPALSESEAQLEAA